MQRALYHVWKDSGKLRSSTQLRYRRSLYCGSNGELFLPSAADDILLACFEICVFASNSWWRCRRVSEHRRGAVIVCAFPTISTTASLHHAHTSTNSQMWHSIVSNWNKSVKRPTNYSVRNDRVTAHALHWEEDTAGLETFPAKQSATAPTWRSEWLGFEPVTRPVSSRTLRTTRTTRTLTVEHGHSRRQVRHVGHEVRITLLRRLATLHIEAVRICKKSNPPNQSPQPLLTPPHSVTSTTGQWRRNEFHNGGGGTHPA